MQQKIRTFGLLLIALAVSNLSAQKDDAVFLEEVKGINRMSLELKRGRKFPRRHRSFGFADAGTRTWHTRSL